MRFVHSFVAVASLLAGAVDASAVSLSSQIAQVGGNGLGDTGSAAGSNTRWAADSFSDTRVNRSGEAIARTDVGSMAAYTLASMTPNDGPANGSVSARAGGTFLLAGIVVTRLPGFEELPATVETTARFTFDPGSTFERLTSFSGGLSGGSDFALGTVSSATPTATSTAQLVVDQPYSLSAAVEMRSGINSVFDTEIGSFSASLDPLQAFVVPEGYVVNAPDGMVVDNIYLGIPASVAAGIEGDYNFDGLVDAADYTVWRDTFSTGGDLPNDTTPDAVTTDDYDLWSTNYSVPVACSSHIPEPGAACLIAIASLTTFACHRGRATTTS